MEFQLQTLTCPE